MKTIVFATLLAVAMGAPQYGYQPPAPPPPPPQPTYGLPALSSNRQNTFESVEVIPTLRDDRVQEDDGTYSVNVETGNGILLEESGSPDGPEDSIVAAGQFSYTSPEGTLITLRYVADGNGFQAEGDHLPVAPEFPHPIPDFVLEQIAKAAEEDAAAARAESSNVRTVSVSAPSRSYGAPL